MSETKGSADTKIATMQAAYEAWPDLDASLSKFRDDAVWHSSMAGEVSGKEAIRVYLSPIMRPVEEWIFEIHDIVVSEEHRVVLGRNDVPFTNGQVIQCLRSAEVFHLDNEDLVRDVWPSSTQTPWRKAIARTG
jgi:limonene-1,2-epoxide hydrolase